MYKRLNKTIQEIRIAKMQETINSNQETIASLYEENIKKDQTILDLQQTIAALYEGSNA